MSQYPFNEKQATVEDWLERIKGSGRTSYCKRNVRNTEIKQNMGHPLSTSEYNLIEAYERFVLTDV